MQRIRQVSVFGALALALTMMTAMHGCMPVATTGATGTDVAYAQGNSYGVVHADPDEVLNAAHAVLRERNMSIVEEEMDQPRPRITARTPANRRIRVMIEPRIPNRTQLWVRYGTFGDRNQSAALFLRIAEIAEGE